MALDKAEFNLVTDCMTIYETKRGEMSDFEVSFFEGKGPNDQYDSLVEKFEKYGEGIKLSEKQIAVMQRMYDRIILGIKPERRR